MRTEALDGYLEPARTTGGIWRPVLGMLITLGVYVLGMIVVVLGWVLLRWAMLGDVDQALESMGGLATTGSRAGVAITLLSFIGIWFGLWIAQVAMHRQSFWTLFDPARRIRWGDIGRGVLVALLFSGVSLSIAAVIIGLPEQSQAVSGWAILLVPLMFCVFLQATAEELIFRGYLLQQLGSRFRSVLVWAVLPSILFGLMHAWNAEGAAAYYYMAITGITGLTLALLVWRTGNLWAAVGMHWAVNVLSLTGVGAEGILSGTQLWLFPKEALMPLLQIDLVVSVVLLALVAAPTGRLLGDERVPRGSVGEKVIE